ncbi:MAG: heme-binding protein [Streptosporangiaceae bacterium]
MSAGAQTDPDFVFADPGTPPLEQAAIERAALAAHPAGPLGPLAQLPGTWKGHGFNTIWRPHHGGQDRFLELNLTTETLVFTKINGPIPNRGLLMGDIDMFGVTYMQQIAETSSGAGLHIEPGIWVHVPRTSNPSEPATVVRMASVPHGTALLAQGTTQFINGGPPHIPDNNIVPFPVGTPPPPNSAFHSGEQGFPELNLSIPTTFRQMSPGVTQAMVRNPNSVIQAGLEHLTIRSRTFIQISTRHSPIRGGGTANTAFLAGASNPPGGNANAVEVDATLWIETVAGEGGQPDHLQLQYSQLVQLDFNGLRWPHVTVATLKKQ